MARPADATAAPVFAPASVMVFVGLDRVGDGLLKLPFVRALRTAFPSARITWVAGKETSVYAGVLAPLVVGLLDEVIENAGIGLGARELLRRPLPGRRFDLIIDTQRVVWITLSLRRIDHRVFVSPAARFLLSSRRPPRGYRRPFPMLRQMLDLIELACGRPFAAPEALDLPLPPADVEAAAKLLPPGPVYVGLAPGAGGAPKCWPLARFIEVAKAQAARGRVPVFVLGPKEEAWRAELAAAVPEALFPLQAEGVRAGYAPPFTIALAARLAAAVANDSGAGHMIAIGGAALVTLYGPTSPEKFRPFTRRLTVIRATDHGGRDMAAIPAAQVIQALEKALAGA